MNVNLYSLGICIIIFILIISLLIFAPKGKNFYNNNEYTQIYDTLKDNYNLLINDLNKIKNEKLWLSYPAKKYISNDYFIYPMFIFNINSYIRNILTINTYNILDSFGNKLSYSFIKIKPQSKLSNWKYWKEYNNCLCFIFVLESLFDDPETCCILVNGELRPMNKNDLMIFDVNKKHSIINETDDNVYLLELIVKKNKGMNSKDKKKYNIQCSEVKKIIKILSHENNITKKLM
jgi:hypothetical protein